MIKDDNDFLDSNKIISLDTYSGDSNEKDKKKSSNNNEFDSIRGYNFLRAVKRYHEELSKCNAYDRIKLYSKDFDMQSAISSTPNISDLAIKAMSEFSERQYFHWIFPYKAECDEIIERIVKMNKEWERNDALLEAAREYAATDYFHQCVLILDIHSNVVYEFQTMTDEEYIELRNKLFEDEEE